MNKKFVIISAFVIALIVFFTWRFLRPMEIFVVDDRFAWHVDTSDVPQVLGDLSAKTCGSCHAEFYKEWQTAMHSQAWTDPYFQADWQFEDKRHSCRLCHTPLDSQQPQKILDYLDSSKWNPVLEDNPDFNAELMHEGVTCAACHYRDGKIVGVLGNTDAPHPTKKLDNPNEVCVRCHVVNGDRWDTFFRFPPCGTVAEIQSNRRDVGRSGETTVTDTAALGCVGCHMPAVKRPLVEGGVVRNARQHLWRGGHDPEMVKKAFTADLYEEEQSNSNQRRFVFEITNTGTRHYLPTGTPDRYLSVEINLLDVKGQVLKQQKERLIRKVMWRPFIIDLWDTRLPYGEPRQYTMAYSTDKYKGAAAIEVKVRYHLVNESRVKRINYQPKEPIDYEVFSKRIEFSDTTKANKNK